MQMQKEKADLDHTSKEVYRKIGRNVLFFQRLEYMIKYLIANGNIKGYISELHSIQEQQTATGLTSYSQAYTPIRIRYRKNH